MDRGIYKLEKMKDPRRQYQGFVNKARGKHFEEQIGIACEYYKHKEIAVIEKTPEPMRPLKPMGKGMFLAFFEKKAQPDYKGTINGGKAIVFEVKFTSSEKMLQSRVTEEQANNLALHHKLGALSYVVIGYGTGGIYRIPWAVWQNMKEEFGRKYITEKDVKDFQVRVKPNGLIPILQDIGGCEK